ncbi:hypothetical protein [Desulfogranum marinum]|uniref:hypothetical protein n=1 Tax=Desulfogranum marinum TaxID=453220 RepID=UPI0019665727|nr:hypothetical protein [Desulfogranum marinum]MBM9511274.1 hypothetical protein [Desulfogranum marinum]
MSTQLSFTKVEKKLLPKFRENINTAESTEDVKKFFSYTIQDLLAEVFSGKHSPAYDDAVLECGKEPCFSLSRAVRSLEDYDHTWDNSDLSHIIERFAVIAERRHNHLEKNPEKTESKIRN